MDDLAILQHCQAIRNEPYEAAANHDADAVIRFTIDGKAYDSPPPLSLSFGDILSLSPARKKPPGTRLFYQAQYGPRREMPPPGLLPDIMLSITDGLTVTTEAPRGRHRKAQ